MTDNKPPLAAAAGAGQPAAAGAGQPAAAGAGQPAANGTKSQCKDEMNTIVKYIGNKFSNFIKKFTGPDKKETDKTITANVKVYANNNKNSKGYSIKGYTVDIKNEEYPFSTADEVNYFLENLIQKNENDILKPDSKVKQDPDTFFKSYKVSIPLFPIKIDSKKEDMKTGGKKKTIKRKRKKHNKSKKINKNRI